MKKQYELIKVMIKIVTILALLEIVLLIIAPDIKHIILTSIVGVCWLLILIFYLIAKKENSNLIFESKENDYEIRLVEYDDYALLREFLDEHLLENSQEEMERLKEYEKITVDYVRTKYHYIVLENDRIVGMFLAKKSDTNWEITWIKIVEEFKYILEEKLTSICSAKKMVIIFK